jgi:hypothetical protein
MENELPIYINVYQAKQLIVHLWEVARITGPRNRLSVDRINEINHVLVLLLEANHTLEKIS